MSSASLTNLLLPGHCLLCGNTHSQEALCIACMHDLPYLDPEHCPHCAEPTPIGEVCPRCLQSLPAFDTVLIPFRYDFPVDPLIHAFKYAGQIALAKWFAQQIFKKIASDYPDLSDTIDCIVPLPLHTKRLKKRGYNQSTEIARALSVLLKKPLQQSLCQRHQETMPQADLPLVKRAQNVRNAFSCHKNLKGMNVLLVDDVLTTGATLNECAHTLKSHGAAHVIGALAARAVLYK